MIIKVCGMRDAENIKEVEALGPDWMGLIFWTPSKRCCNVKPDYLPSKCKRVGVFVNAEIGEVVEKYVEYRLDAIQLHGDEDRLYVMALRKAIGALGDAFHPYSLIKAFPIKNVDDLQKTDPLVGFVDYFLFDTPTSGRGGSGKQFDWSVLSQYRNMTPFILSGGIAPESAPALKAFQHPCCMGIDLNSQFEKAPGLKDVEKLKTFIAQMREE